MRYDEYKCLGCDKTAQWWHSGENPEIMLFGKHGGFKDWKFRWNGNKPEVLCPDCAEERMWK